VTSHCDDDPEKPFIISKLHKIIDRFEHIISLHMVLPETDRGKANTLFAALTSILLSCMNLKCIMRPQSSSLTCLIVQCRKIRVSASSVC
jgi:hypothetical protein